MELYLIVILKGLNLAGVCCPQSAVTGLRVCVFISLPLKPSHSFPAKTHQRLYTTNGRTVALVAKIPDSNICIEY